MPGLSVRAKVALTAGFAFASGWADVICFTRYGAFAALMTGNAVKVGIAAATEDENRVWNVLFYICILLCYILGGTLFQEIKRRFPTRPALVAAPVCLALIVAGDIFYKIFGANQWQVCVLAPAFGIQNSLTFGGAMEINTTIITGNIQKLSIALHQILTRKMTKSKLVGFVGPAIAVLATIASATAGAFVLIDVAKMDATWLFVPAGILQSMCMVIQDIYLQRKSAAADTPSSNGTGQADLEVGMDAASTAAPGPESDEASAPLGAGGAQTELAPSPGSDGTAARCIPCVGFAS